VWVSRTGQSVGSSPERKDALGLAGPSHGARRTDCSLVRPDVGSRGRGSSYRRDTVRDTETNMAYGIIHRFAGGNEDQYGASIAAVHPSDDSLPEGQVFHAAGPFSEGLGDRGDPRVEGELGELPRRHPYASDAGRNRGRFPSAPAGDWVRGQEPTVRLTRR
jgi:hypothetical protein